MADPIFDIRFDQKQIDDVVATLRGIKKGVPRVLTRSLNATATTTRNQAVKEARKDVRLTAKFLKERIKGPSDLPQNKATFSRLAARVTAGQRGLRLSHFLSGKQPTEGKPKKDPKVKVKPGGASKAITGGFFLKLRNTGTASEGPKLGLFVREGDKLVHLYGPSPSQIFTQELPELSKAMSKVLLTNVARETQAVLRQYGGS